MQITAIDRKAALSGTANPTETTLTVDVRSVNAHAPKILVTQLQTLENPAAFTGNQFNKVTCATLTITDPDSDNHGEIAFTRIVKGDPDGLIEIEPGNEPNEKRLVFSKRPPPINAVMNLTVEVSDNGTPPRSSRVGVQIQLYDRDSFVPKFTEPSFRMRVSEASPRHTQVGFVNVTGESNAVRFSIISGNGRRSFEINPHTGLITTQRHLDRNAKAIYTLTVAATNVSLVLGDALNTTTVVIEIEDANDHDPLFTDSTYKVVIPESLPAGSFVIQVHAEDRDAGNNGSILYTLVGNPSEFKIDPINGTILTTKKLDYDLMRSSYKLRVRATDSGTPFTRKSECFVKVTVSNVNDNAPMFVESECLTTLPQSSNPGSPLAQLNPVDIDHNPFTCSLLSGNRDLFEVEELNCLLKLRSRVDQEALGSLFVLQIVATDEKFQSDPVFVNVTISSSEKLDNKCIKSGRVQDYEESLNQHLLNPGRDVRVTSNVNRTSQIPNKYRPQIRPEGKWSNVLIPEDKPIGTVVTKVQAVDRDNGFNGKLWYTITSGNGDSCFNINTQTGVISIVKLLDRERTSRYNLTVSVSDMGSPTKTAFTKITIIVADVNDNPPVFGQTRFKFSLHENVTVGFVIQQNIWASDLDEGRNANISYSLSSAVGGNKFAINKTTGFIKVMESLDREDVSEYKLTVIAKDAGEHPLSSSASVLIHVADVNDNPPRFHQDVFRIKVTEDLPVGTVVFRLQSYDPDMPEHSEVRYSLTAGMSDHQRRGEPKFNVDPRTGYIRISAKLDYRVKTRYNITARARDRVYRVATCYIEVEILPVNRNLHAPYFNLPEDKFEVLESAEIGKTVGIASAVDDDIGEPENSIGYSIVDGTGLGIFAIDENTGIITTSRQLDRETERFYWLTIKATDRGAIPLSGTMFVLVEVGNINDNAPIATQPIFFASIRENSPLGSQVVQVHAVDLDGDHDTIQYRMSVNNTYFKINTSTGIITTKKRKLDRERISAQDMRFEVLISDGGEPPLSSFAKVVVELIDENDNPPKFRNIESLLQIPARNRTRMPVEVARVVAYDKDEGRNAKIKYKINGNSRFKINPNNGVITTQQGFKEGTRSVIKVVATDNGNPARHSKHKRVDIHWTGQPLNSLLPPKIAPNSVADVLIFETVERQFRGSQEQTKLVTLVKATDEDSDEIRFMIMAGDDDRMFHLNSQDGSLVTAGYPDAEIQNFYNLTIWASDGYNNDVANIVVRIGDLNDHRPVFDQAVYEHTISENTTVGTMVFQVTATDGDIEPRQNGNLIYRIWSSVHSTSQDKFRITSDGVIYTQGELDREVQREHIFIIEVDDQGSPFSLQGYCRVVITIGDINEHAPRFTASSYSGIITVGAADQTTGAVDMKSSSVVTVRASDQDTGMNAKIEYSIVEGNDDGLWRIDPSSGEIFPTETLTAHENIQPMVLTVQASDSATTPLSSTVEVTIQVRHDDSAPPKFEADEITANLDENLPSGSYVTTVKASAPFGVTYMISMVNDDEPVFSINAHSGVISLVGALDRETTSSYIFNVTAVTTEGTTSTTTINVNINDINDNRPEFEKLRYSGSVSESSGSAASSSIDGISGPLIVRALDKDIGDNGRVRYSIAEASDEIHERFSVDQYTGAVRTKAGANLFDYSIVQHYSFEVKASDIGSPTLRSSRNAEVTVNIIRTGISSPKFSKSHYSSNLYLPTCNGVVISQEISASYSDPFNQNNVTYSITGGNVGNAFSIDLTTGAVTVSDSSDMQNQYALRLQASDGIRSTVTVLTVMLHNLESQLSFSKEIYEAEVMESSTEIEPVVVVTVAGLELEDNIRFTILNPTPHFKIGITSGIIETTGVPVDRESNLAYEILVEAVDVNMPQNGGQVRRGRCIVNVTINDCNDNNPLFVGLPYYSTVQVDALPHTFVKQVHAIDADTGLNGQVTYTLSGSYSELFTIDPVTGNITVSLTPAGVLGSNNANFNITLTATDMGTPKRSGTSNLRISLVNRATPVFTMPFYDEIMVPEDAKLHTVVTSDVLASSPDGSDVYYTIESGDPLQLFDIDFIGGTITTMGSLDFEKRNHYQLRVRARDAASRAYADVEVTLRVTDINDNDPIFTENVYSHTLPEYTRVGTQVAKVEATDADSGAFGSLSYTILPGSEDVGSLFLIDLETGVIWTASNLDAETKSEMEFVVRASDGGSPARYCDVTVRVIVNDVNDNPPIFDQSVYEFFISSEAKAQSFVGKVLASDPDVSDKNKIRYSLRQTSDGMLEIDQPTGIITLASTNAFKDIAKVYANVSATDGLFTTTVDIMVQINTQDTSPNALLFDQPAYNFTIEENQAAGSIVGTIGAQSTSTASFSMESENFNSDLFTIHPNSGVITTTQSIDRETIAVGHNVALVQFYITVTDEIGQINRTLVSVKITDVNDNPPVFLQSSYGAVLVVTEAELYSKVLQVSTNDYDYGVNGSVRYSIVEDLNTAKELLTLDMDTGELTLRQNPQRLRNRQVLSFFIRATDGGSVEKLRSLTSVSIYLTSHPESVPIFTQDVYEATIAENQVSSNLTTVKASANGTEIIYKLAHHFIDSSLETEDDYEYAEEDMITEPPNITTELYPEADMFSVDSVSGQISLLNPVDREHKSSYEVTVLAFVKTTPELVASAKVQIRITDVNDYSPTFMSSNYEVSITEGLPAGQNVVQVHAVDKDNGEFGKFTYSIKSSPTNNNTDFFSIDPKTGLIQSLLPLDREIKPFYTLTVQAIDLAGNNDTTSVNINVVDINDSPPEFSGNRYTITISESVDVGYLTRKFLRISDNDTSLSTNIQVYITVGNSDGKFAVVTKSQKQKNLVTAGLQVVKSLDREDKDHYELTILATDGLYTDTTVVHVTIGDINDNAPDCSQLEYRGFVREDAATQTLILNILSTDADIGEAGRVSYQLTGTGSDQFNLDPRTGELRTARALDREITSEYSLTAISIDGGDKQCISKVHITVEDINDNPPIFVSTSLRHSTRENTPTNSSLHRVVAFDPDQGLNGSVTYQLRDNMNNQFSIESKTGVLVLNKPLDRETVPSYQIEIIAIDDGTMRMSTTDILHLQILDVNDNPPIFDLNQYNTEFREDASVGLVVLQVSAHSIDSGANAKLRYSITHGNEHGKFVINQDSGEIRLIATVDYESDQSYVLTISAADRSSNPLSSECTVRIAIIDVNDNAPVFTATSYEIEISEDAEIGRTVTTVSATDKDSGAAGNITYTLGSNTSPFKIHPVTGAVTITEPGIDYETKQSFSIQIFATDHGLPAQSAETTLVVTVTDVNDNQPTFIVTPPPNADSGSVQCSEDATNCTVFAHESSSNSVVHGVVSLNATDADGVNNGQPFRYRIMPGASSDLFYLDDQNVLKSRQPLRLNDASQNLNSQRLVHQLSLEVKDSGSPAPLTSAPLLLNIIVLKESQYAPQMTSHYIHVSVFGDEFCGGQITQSLHATDRDLFDEDRLRFSLATPDDFERFLIYPTSGAIISESPLQTGTHDISVRVSDGSRFNVAAIPVKVTEITQLALENSVSISFVGIQDKEQYLALFHSLFIDQLSVSVLPNGFNRERDLIVISLQSIEDRVELLFSVKRPPPDTFSRSFYQSKRLKSSLETNRELIEEKLRVEVFSIEGTSCSNIQCTQGKKAKCRQVPSLIPYSKTNPSDPVSSISWSLVTPKFTRQSECICPPGTVSPTCEPACSDTRNPCSDGLFCTPDLTEPNKYRCSNPILLPSVMSFNGKSSANYKLSRNMRHTPFRVNLRIRTFQSNATLLYATGNQDFAHLQTFNGLIKFSFDCGSGPQFIVRDAVKINDGHWHDINVQSVSQQNSPCGFQITVDQIYTSRLLASTGRPNLDLTDVTLGEFPGQARSKRNKRSREQENNIRSGFRGCLEDVEVNEVDFINLPPNSKTSGITLISLEDVENSCMERVVTMGACMKNPCLNGGSCFPAADGHHRCDCLSNFVGDRCEVLNPCGGEPCLNNGRCLATGREASCRCKPGFSGHFCEVFAGCKSKKCQNDGSCVMDSRSHASCSCMRGWSGKHCEKNVNECLTPLGLKTCGKLEHCFDYPGGFACNCSASGDVAQDTRCNAYHAHLKTAPSEAGLDMPTIIAIIVSFVVLVAIIIIVVLLIRRRRKKTKHYRRGSHRSKEFELTNSFNPDSIRDQHPPPPIPSPPTGYRPTSREMYGYDSTNHIDQEQRRPLFCRVQPQPVSPSSVSDNDSIKKPPASWQDYDSHKFNGSASSVQTNYKTSGISINEQQNYEWDDMVPPHLPSFGTRSHGGASDVPSSPDSRRSVSSHASRRSRRSDRSNALPGHYSSSAKRRREKQLFQMIDTPMRPEDKMRVQQVLNEIMNENAESLRGKDSRNSSIRSSSSRYRPSLPRNEPLPPPPPEPVSPTPLEDSYPAHQRKTTCSTSDEPMSSSSCRPSGSDSDSAPRSSGSERLPPPPTDHELRVLQEEDEDTELDADLPPPLANESYSSLLGRPFDIGVPTPAAVRSTKFHPDQYLYRHHPSDISETSGSIPGSSLSLDVADLNRRLMINGANQPQYSHYLPEPTPPPPLRHDSERLEMSSLSEAEEDDELIPAPDQRQKRRYISNGRPPIDPKSRSSRRPKKSGNRSYKRTENPRPLQVEQHKLHSNEALPRGNFFRPVSSEIGYIDDAGGNDITLI
uniref:protocadherin Fat 1 n=1 Tax=Ciona intestinalis TaxID=7719 RepID=UPI000EF4A607|nr:protocadherin Fat 1 [Ciona intestinalis]|eukprot:XP_018670260.2 protocadherin Fat 1 [Ciona intestinalis]